MRLAILGSRGYPSTYGGFETFVREFAPRVRDAGHEVLVYCRADGGRRRSWSVDGVECRRTRGIAARWLSTLSFGMTASWDVRKRDVDAVLVLNCANGFWLPMIKSAGVPVAVNVDGLEWRRKQWNPIGRRVFALGASLSARHANALVADSRAIQDVWRRRFEVEPRYIPYGARVVEDRAADKLAELGIEPGSYVLSVARLVPENNVGMALQAMDLIDDSVRPLHVIVGSAVPDAPWLESEVRRASKRSRDVLWLGHVDDQELLTQLYRHCAVYVHGHSVGGTNPSLLQALGAGAPVLAYDTPFNREVIGYREVFWLTAGELAAQLQMLLQTPDARDQLSRFGQQRVRGHYRWDQVCRQYLELLEGLARARLHRGQPALSP